MTQPVRTIRPLWLVVTVILLLAADQGLKYWIKTNLLPGQEVNVIGSWFKLHFVENNGMAFGLSFAGQYGKLILTLFRILAVGGIIYYIVSQYKQNAHKGFLICLSLILAGAIGNIIDCVFYGKFFASANQYSAGWFHGQVVDMLHFDLVQGHYPSWVPGVGGNEFAFFNYIFNIADACISVGVISILVFRRRFFKKSSEETIPLAVEVN